MVSDRTLPYSTPVYCSESLELTSFNCHSELPIAEKASYEEWKSALQTSIMYVFQDAIIPGHIICLF